MFTTENEQAGRKCWKEETAKPRLVPVFASSDYYLLAFILPELREMFLAFFVSWRKKLLRSAQALPSLPPHQYEGIPIVQTNTKLFPLFPIFTCLLLLAIHRIEINKQAIRPSFSHPKLLVIFIFSFLLFIIQRLPGVFWVRKYESYTLFSRQKYHLHFYIFLPHQMCTPLVTVTDDDLRLQCIPVEVEVL